jgi:glutamine amidotransferase
MNVALFDYGAGNLHSLGKALEGAGARVRVTSDWNVALGGEALVLPGVGAFGTAAAALPKDRARVRDALAAGLPCLGICLGMQLLFDDSEEAAGKGIGLMPGSVRLLDARIVPQMGWSDVETGADPIFDGVTNLVAYFANSYVCVPADASNAIAWSEYDAIRSAAGARRANTWGLQFHPEKSSAQGRRIIENFVALARAAS